MRKISLAIFALLAFGIANAQHTFKGVVKDSLTKEILSGASVIVKSLTGGSTSNQAGEITINNIPGGRQIIIVSHVGYQAKEFEFTFPMADSLIVELVLSQENETLENVIVQ